MVRKLLVITCLLLITLGAVAQQQFQKFDPAKFKAEREQFITVEACLTPSEAAAFFPLYDEMNNQLRGLYEKMRQYKQFRPTDEAKCREVINQMDQLEIEMKQLQMNYHARFLTVMSARKLFDVMKAEDKFHRQAMRRASHNKK